MVPCHAHRDTESCRVLCRPQAYRATPDSLLLKFSLATRRHPPDITFDARERRHYDRGGQFMSRKLYVGNLPYETGEAELQELFARAGTVETVKVMRDMATGRARGFAFVEMSTDEEAQKAITELNAYQLGGRGLTVNEARPKPEHTGRFGGGDSRRRRS